MNVETRSVLNEIILHSLARTGEVAQAIDARLVALRDDSILTAGHRAALEEWVSMVSEYDEVGDNCIRWRDAVRALPGVLRTDPIQTVVEDFMASLRVERGAGRSTRAFRATERSLAPSVHLMYRGNKEGPLTRAYPVVSQRRAK